MSYTGELCLFQEERHAGISRRAVLSGIAAIAATALPAVATPTTTIADLYRENRRRCEEACRSGDDLTADQHDWIDEPLYEALELEPQSAADWAALTMFVISGADLSYNPDAAEAALGHARRVLEKEA